MPEKEQKIVSGNFSDDRLRQFVSYIKDQIYEKGEELQLPVGTIIGCLENIKHEIQHEFLTISGDMVEY